MSSQKTATASRQSVALLIAAAMPAICYALQGAMGLSLWDEGFLWYGAQRVMAGEVPIRDFNAYDLGRYYWSAALMSLLGSNGILAMRISNTVLQSLTIIFGTYLVTRTLSRPSMSFALMAAATFLIWVLVVDFKIADYTASILLIFAVSLIIEKPNLRRYFLAGIVIGFAAILGRNHGVYGVVATLGATAYLFYIRAVRPLSALAAWSAGIVVGYLPMLIVLALVPGFASEFWASVRVLFELNATNLPRPWPRPWWVHFDDRHFWTDELRQMMIGLFFIALPVFGLLGLAYSLWKGTSKDTIRNPVFIAAALLALPYAHYAFSRADVAHLSLGIFPLLVGAMTLPFALSVRSRLAFMGLLFATSVFVVVPTQPGYRALREGDWQVVTVGKDQLLVSPDTASELALLTMLADQYAPNGRFFVAAPFWPGAYAVLERKSPLWEIYALFPRSEAFQQADIARIRAADPGFVLVIDYPLDGRQDLRYQNNRAVIERYISSTFQLLIDIEKKSGVRIRTYVPTGADQNLTFANEPAVK